MGLKGVARFYLFIRIQRQINMNLYIKYMVSLRLQDDGERGT